MNNDLDAIIRKPLQSLAERIREQHKRSKEFADTFSVEIKQSQGSFEIGVADSLQEIGEKMREGAKPSTLDALIRKYAKDNGIDLASYGKNGASPYDAEELGLRNFSTLLLDELKKNGMSLEYLQSGFEAEVDKTMDEITDRLIEYYDGEIDRMLGELK